MSSSTEDNKVSHNLDSLPCAFLKSQFAETCVGQIETQQKRAGEPRPDVYIIFSYCSGAFTAHLSWEILVPNSSPITQNDYPIHPYHTYGHPMNHNMVTSSNPFASSTWLSAPLGSAFDPLSAPGGLIPHGGLLNATSRRRLNDDDDVRYEGGPPRKRINRGLSEDVPNIPRSPPEIHRIRHRRHILAIGPDAISLSSVGVQLLKKGSQQSRIRGRWVWKGSGWRDIADVNGLHSLRITVHIGDASLHQKILISTYALRARLRKLYQLGLGVTKNG